MKFSRLAFLGYQFSRHGIVGGRQVRGVLVSTVGRSLGTHLPGLGRVASFGGFVGRRFGKRGFVTRYCRNRGPLLGSMLGTKRSTLILVNPRKSFDRNRMRGTVRQKFAPVDLNGSQLQARATTLITYRALGLLGRRWGGDWVRVCAPLGGVDVTGGVVSQLSMLTMLVIFLTTYSGAIRCAGVVPTSTAIIASVGLGSLTDGTKLGSGRGRTTGRGMLRTLGDKVGTTAFRRLRGIVGGPDRSKVSMRTPICMFASPSFPCSATITGVGDRSSLRTSLRVVMGRRVYRPVGRTTKCDFAAVGKNLITFGGSTMVLVSMGKASRVRGTGRNVAGLLGRATSGDVTGSNTFRGVRGRGDSVGFFTSVTTVPTPCRRRIDVKLPTRIGTRSVAVVTKLGFRGKEVTLGARGCARGRTMGTLVGGRLRTFKGTGGAFMGCFPTSALVFIGLNVGKRNLCGLLDRGGRFHGAMSVSGTSRIGRLFDSFGNSVSTKLVGMAVGDTPAFVICTSMGGNGTLRTLCGGGRMLKLGGKRSVLRLNGGRCICGDGKVGMFFNVGSGRVCTAGSRLLCGGVRGITSGSVGSTPCTSRVGKGAMFVTVGTRTVLRLPIIGVLVKFNNRGFQANSRVLSGISCLSIDSRKRADRVSLYLGSGSIGTLGLVISFNGRFANVWFMGGQRR